MKHWACPRKKFLFEANVLDGPGMPMTPAAVSDSRNQDGIADQIDQTVALELLH